MAIAGANKIAETSTADATSFTTAASLTPSTNTLYLATVRNSRAAGPATPTLSGGGGLTWVQVATVTEPGGSERITVFRAMKSSGLTSGTLTADFGGVTQTGFAIVVDEFTGTDTTGSDGAGAIVQSATGSGSAVTSSSVTLAAFGDATNNAAFGAVSIIATDSISAEGGYTRLSNLNHATPNRAVATEWKVGQDTSVTFSWTTSAAYDSIAVEIKAAAAGNTVSGVGAIASAEAFGTPAIVKLLGPGGITSAQTFGTPAALRILGPAGITSAAAVGQPKALRILAAPGITSGELFGLAKALRILGPVGIVSGETFGRPTVTAFVIVPDTPPARGDIALGDQEMFNVVVSDREIFLVLLVDREQGGIVLGDTPGV
jgi:hypothetical protein